MCYARLVSGFAIVLFAVTIGRTDSAAPAADGASPTAVAPPYAYLELGQQPLSPGPVLAEPAAPHSSPSPLVDPAFDAQPQFGPPTVIVPATAPPAAPPPPLCDGCGCVGECTCGVIGHHSGWTLGFELYGLQSHVTDGAFGRWPDQGGTAARITIGYEWQSGFGMRGNSWGFFDDVELVGDDVELTMGTFQLDFYKTIVTPQGELVLGAGPTGGSLEFEIPGDDARTRFSGGGATAFIEGYYPFFRRPRWEFAFVGQTRMSLLAGDWRDNGGRIVDDTNGDSMTIWEIGFGLEYRHAFGPCDEHFWFVRAMPEFQQWKSEWMGEFLGSSVALTGTNLSLGLTW